MAIPGMSPLAEAGMLIAAQARELPQADRLRFALAEASDDLLFVWNSRASGSDVHMAAMMLAIVIVQGLDAPFRQQDAMVWTGMFFGFTALEELRRAGFVHVEKYPDTLTQREDDGSGIGVRSTAVPGARLSSGALRTWRMMNRAFDEGKA